jgi:hypothetical protein
LRPAGSVAALLAGAARGHLIGSLQGRALWLRTDGQGRPVLRITGGLPRGDDFSAML